MACRDCEDLYSFPVGPQGPAGEDGTAGVNGNYITVANEAAGLNCANGGKKITLYNGADDSVLATHYVCDGADGSDGSDGTSLNKFIYEEYVDISGGQTLLEDTSLRYKNIIQTVAFCSDLTDGCGDDTPRNIDFSMNIWFRASATSNWINITNSQYFNNHVADVQATASGTSTTLTVRVTRTGYYRIVAIG